MRGLLVIFLIDIKTIRQTGEKSFNNDIIHSQASFKAPESRRKDWE